MKKGCQIAKGKKSCRQKNGGCQIAKRKKSCRQKNGGCQTAKSPKKKKNRSADPRLLPLLRFLPSRDRNKGWCRALPGLVVEARRHRSCVAGLVAVAAGCGGEGVVSRRRLGAAGFGRDAGRFGRECKLLEGRLAIMNASCGGFLIY